MARRIVCNMPANALTQVFCALHKDVVKSMDEYIASESGNTYSYSDILTYHIMRRDGNYQLPRDTQFIESIKLVMHIICLSHSRYSYLNVWKTLFMENTTMWRMI